MPAPPGRRREPPSPLVSAGCSVSLLALTGFGTMCFGLDLASMAVNSPAMLLLAVALATVFTVPHTLAVLWLDRHEAEPVWLIAGAFLWGAVGATALGGLANALAEAGLLALLDDATLSHFATASLIAPATEEVAKAMALVGLFVLFRHELDGVLDGIVYGAVVGLGFAWFENITYYMRASQDGVGPMLALAWVRGVLHGAGGHATFTGLTGLGFGMFRALRQHPARWFVPPAALATAMFAHFCWNTFTSVLISGPLEAPTTLLLTLPLAVALLQLPFLLFLLGIAALTLRHEAQLIGTYLALEPADVATPADITHLVPARRRMWHGLHTLRTQGLGVWWDQHRLAAALVELAFARWHHAADQLPWSHDDDDDVQRHRATVRALRDQGIHLAPPKPRPTH